MNKIKDINIIFDMDCILEPEQYNLIFRVSFLSLGSSVYAIHNGYYDLALCPGGVFLTSITYWVKPDYSWRRYLDMLYVKFALSYQLYKAYNSQYMVYYYTLIAITVAFYPLGVYYYKKKLYWKSTYSHCMLHLIANIANIVLYSGRIA
jgi:hypothetical protein